MRERPILMSAPMVRAILDGRKTQTRRIMKPQPDTSKISTPFRPEPRGDRSWVFMARTDFPAYSYATADFKAPWAVGDTLWVRETTVIAPPRWTSTPTNPMGPHRQEVAYVADDRTGSLMEAARDYKLKKTPAIHMPRWASRITLEITDIRVEKIADISEEDAKAEGLKCLSKDGGRTYKYGIPDRDGWPGTDDDGWAWEEWDVSPRAAFAELWDSIHGPAAFNRDPWVWAISFRRVDQQARAA